MTSPSSRRGFALIIVLFLVVVLSAILVAFVTIMTFDRQASQSYAQGVRAEQVARGAFEDIESQMIDEIAADSTRYGADGTTANANSPYVYWPKSATNMVLQDSGVTNALPLVKISNRSTNFYAGGTIQASASSSTNASFTGRVFSLARWNKPQFFTTWPAAVQAPDWVYVTRSGPQVVTQGSIGAAGGPQDASLANNNFVVGRYAYAVYDVSGLLDVTAAGYVPNASGSDLSQPFIGQKGYEALAELTNLPANGATLMSQAQVTGLAQWRNQATYTASQNYLTNFINTNGGTTVYPGDNTFINRQDLINYATLSNFPGVLPYLTTFHRSLNAPDFTPDANAMTSGPYAYLNNAFGTTGSTNYCVPNIRVLNANAGWLRTNDDGTMTASVAGESLVKKRFPLSRLGLFTQATPNAGLMTAYFGLSEGAGGIHDAWTYTALHSGNAANANVHISTLDEVASTGREPNFFELLKAAILTGSTGRDAGDVRPWGGSTLPYSEVEQASVTMDLHIFRIGANIIDQYGANNYPTTINTQLFSPAWIPSNFVYGIKNLPYFQRVVTLAMDPTPPAFDGSTVSYAQMWLWPILWNPHQNTGLANSAMSYSSLPGPTKLRIQAFGSSEISMLYWTTPHPPSTTGFPNQPSGASTSTALFWNSTNADSDTSHPMAYIPFSVTAADFWSAPVPMTVALADPSTSQTNIPSQIGTSGNWTTVPASQPVAFGLPAVPYVPDAFTKTNTFTASNQQKIVFDWQDSLLTSTGTNPLDGTFFAMQWFDSSSSTWRTYQIVNSLQNNKVGFLDAVNNGVSPTTLNPTTGAVGTTNYSDGYMLPDARTDRFGAYIPDIDASITLTNTMRRGVPPGSSPAPAAADFLNGFPNPPSSSGGAFSVVANNWYAGNLTQNTSTATASVEYYTDRDGVLRGADGFYSAGTLPDGYPLANGTTANLNLGYSTNGARPIVLSRPFRSVGELGYAFRDVPFKSLDFFSAQSGDTGLLDLFSIDQAGTNSGKVNLNSAPAPVIKALLNNGLKKEIDATQLISATDASNVASYVANGLATSPMMHRGDLVQALSGITMTSSPDRSDKTQREAAVRSLAEVSDARTWNVLIDVVAQAGRFSPQASNLTTDFQVQGEKRYWLHLSIDRITGQVISSQLEPVYE